ncbi:MAG: uncharacterized membrane protein HdeD (DUF308 family) [Paracoccaceae bacterium]|jgi:uncharacterized membrane protein HdeD (DUF308 family)
MIEKNLGNIERLLRLVMGVVLGLWVMLQPSINGVEWFALAVGMMLILNGVFSRCYLWYVFDLNTRSHSANA